MSVAAAGNEVRSGWPRPWGAARQLSRGAAHLWGVIALILLWELWVTVHHYNAIVMPHPAAVASDLIHHPGAYGSALGWTVALAIAGLVGGMLVGIIGASVVRLSPVLSGLSTPVSVVLQAVPVVAMIPVLGRLFGYTERTQIIVAGVVCFFPAFVLTGSGLRQPPSGAENLMGVLGVSRWQRLKRVELPGAVPNILVALRLSAPLSVLAAMLAEFLMGTKGLGYLFVTSSILLQDNRSWGAAVLSTAVSVTFFLLASRFERKLNERWT
jgi:ABC-type nitrate/sulfonate/bicarbonate transport system permease component